MPLIKLPSFYVAPIGNNDTNYINAVNAQNPSGFWLLDETSGTTMNDSTTNWPGTYSTAITSYSKFGATPGSKSISFSASPARLGLTNSTTLMGSGNVFTIMGWVNGGTGTKLVVASCVATIVTRFISVGVDNGRLFCETYSGGNQVTFYSTMPLGTITNNELWYHIAVTLNNGTISFFMNGTSYGTAAYTYTAGTFNQAFKIGVRNLTASGTSYTQYWEGLIDNVALWVGTALSGAQISTIYNSALTPPLQNQGIFAGGNIVATTNTYIFSSDTVAAGTALSIGRRYSGTISSSSNAYIGGGTNGTDQSLLEKYRYFSNSISSITSLSVARVDPAYGGTTTLGIWTMGQSPSATNTTDKLTYSTDTRTTGTNSSMSRAHSGATSNQTDLFAAGGIDGSSITQGTSYLYNFAGNSWSGPKTSITATAMFAGVGGTTEDGFFFGGSTNGGSNQVTTVQKYNYSGNSITSVTALGSANKQAAAACTTTTAYIGGGNGGVPTTQVLKYVFASGSQSTGTSLTYSCIQESASSNCHAGL